MLEFNWLVNMTNMANKTEVTHDWVTWPQEWSKCHHFPGFPGQIQPKTQGSILS